MVMRSFCCNCGEGTRGGFCVNQFCDDVILLFAWGIFVMFHLLDFVAVSVDYVMNVDFNDSS